VVFIDLRDRSGIVQLVFNEQYNRESFKIASLLKSEYVIRAFGEVRLREKPNPNIPTGKLEIWIDEVTILNPSKTPPIGVIKQDDISEDLRLRYRYIDLRREEMRNNIIMRHRIVNSIYSYLYKNGYLNVETPFLTKSTPEGARDFLVPSRLNKGKFYALPQSPQIFKQLLMISGFEKYFQIVKCFRDEDLRADRQPEFTQIDIEASFIEEDDIYNLVDGMFRAILEDCYGKTLNLPLLKLTYDQALELYGTDRPDLRIPCEIINLELLSQRKPNELIRKGFNEGKKLFCIIVPQSDNISRKVLDLWAASSKSEGVQLFTWLKRSPGSTTGPMMKLFGSDLERDLSVLKKDPMDESTLLLAAFGEKNPVLTFLGKLRTEIGRASVDKKRFEFCWITDFPLFEWSEEEGRIVSVHHPFTSPKIEHLGLLQKEPLTVKSKSYDLVLNGVELGGGSIRIHQSNLQEQIFAILGLTRAEWEKKFGFLLEALQYGAPPHGGIAFGLDRIVMILQGEESIRDVIPFPKTTSGTSPLSGAPDVISKEQLAELGLRML
jgi:aspartyl-tRNA synthetase